MNCLLASEIYCFSLLLPQCYLLVETWPMFVFLWLHSHSLFLPSPHISKAVQMEKEELKASCPLCWGLTEERCKWSPAGCRLSHKNLRLLINTVDTTNELTVVFTSLNASTSSPTSISQPQFWTAFLRWHVSVNRIYAHWINLKI